ncbi:MAG: hypothetical protein U0798_17215 [Gemmataceae bacterium]
MAHETTLGQRGVAEFRKAGYEISSAYTVVKNKSTQFIYRDALWTGADMFGTGVASFGHVNVHIQNVDTWEKYIELLSRDELPLGRAYATNPRQRLIREMVLQLKKGRLDPAYFQAKFGADITKEFASGFQQLQQEGWLTLDSKGIELTPNGLLQVDRHLPTFFDPEFRTSRYA